jgi:hypothetical protein
MAANHSLNVCGVKKNINLLTLAFYSRCYRGGFGHGWRKNGMEARGIPLGIVLAHPDKAAGFRADETGHVQL